MCLNTGLVKSSSRDINAPNRNARSNRVREATEVLLRVRIIATPMQHPVVISNKVCSMMEMMLRPRLIMSACSHCLVRNNNDVVAAPTIMIDPTNTGRRSSSRNRLRLECSMHF